MEEINLPIIRGKTPEPKQLNMDEYFKFVTFNLKYTVDRKAVEKWKRLTAVNVPFKMEKQ